MAAVSPAPRRQRVSVFPTPDIRDLLFYERVDSKLPQWSVTPAYGDPHPDSLKYPNHKLCYVRPATEGGDNGWQDWFYAAPRDDQDNYNYSFSQADIGGTQFDAIVRTYVVLRTDFTDYSVAAGDADSALPSGVFSGSYILAEQTMKRIDDRELDSIFVTWQLTFVKRCTQKIARYDEDSRASLSASSFLYYATEPVPGTTPSLTAAALFDDTTNSFWGLDSSGVVREGKQLSCNWYQITETETIAQRIPTAIPGAGGASGIPLRTYLTMVDFYWPATLVVPTSTGPTDIILKAITRKSKSGTYTRNYPRVQFATPPYRGACEAMVQEWWVRTPLTNLPPITRLKPKEIDYTGANYSIRIEPTLHKSIAFTDTIGSSDPEFVAAAYGESFGATDPDERPSSVLAQVEQTPFRGGYRVTLTTVYAP